METIRVICTELENTDIESKLYIGEEPIIVDNVHLGQISSNMSWAYRDITNNFREELDKLFPNGDYVFVFKLIPYERMTIEDYGRRISTNS